MTFKEVPSKLKVKNGKKWEKKRFDTQKHLQCRRPEDSLIKNQLVVQGARAAAVLQQVDEVGAASEHGSRMS
jgi:hypothetical protein